MDSMDVAGRSCARAEGPRQGHWRGENVLELWGKYCRDSRWAACGEAPVISGDPSRCTREQAATTDDARSIRRKDEGACRAAGEVLAWMHRATNVEYRQGPPLVRTRACMDEGGCLHHRSSGCKPRAHRVEGDSAFSITEDGRGLPRAGTMATPPAWIGCACLNVISSFQASQSSSSCVAPLFCRPSSSSFSASCSPLLILRLTTA